MSRLVIKPIASRQAPPDMPVLLRPPRQPSLTLSHLASLQRLTAAASRRAQEAEQAARVAELVQGRESTALSAAPLEITVEDAAERVQKQLKRLRDEAPVQVTEAWRRQIKAVLSTGAGGFASGADGGREQSLAYAGASMPTVAVPVSNFLQVAEAEASGAGGDFGLLSSGQFQARLWRGGELISLGHFDTAVEAAAAYARAVAVEGAPKETMAGESAAPAPVMATEGASGLAPAAASETSPSPSPLGPSPPPPPSPAEGAWW